MKWFHGHILLVNPMLTTQSWLWFQWYQLINWDGPIEKKVTVDYSRWSCCGIVQGDLLCTWKIYTLEPIWRLHIGIFCVFWGGPWANPRYQVWKPSNWTTQRSLNFGVKRLTTSQEDQGTLGTTWSHAGIGAAGRLGKAEDDTTSMQKQLRELTGSVKGLQKLQLRKKQMRSWKRWQHHTRTQEKTYGRHMVSQRSRAKLEEG